METKEERRQTKREWKQKDRS